MSVLYRYSLSIPVALLLVFALITLNTAQADKVLEEPFTDLQGKQHRLSDFKGKWVIVNYWATWCPPCLEEIPDLTHFYDKHKDKVMVLGMNLEEIKSDKLETFVDDNFIDYPVIPTEYAEKVVLGPIRGLPATFILDPEGKPHAAHTGLLKPEDLEKYTSLPAK